MFFPAKGRIASQGSDKGDSGLENGMPPGQGPVPLSSGAPAGGKQEVKCGLSRTISEIQG